MADNGQYLCRSSLFRLFEFFIGPSKPDLGNRFGAFQPAVGIDMVLNAFFFIANYCQNSRQLQSLTP